MGKRTGDSRGFTLIAALLLTLLLSAMAVGLMYLVSNEQRMGNNDLEGNIVLLRCGGWHREFDVSTLPTVPDVADRRMPPLLTLSPLRPIGPPPLPDRSSPA